MQTFHPYYNYEECAKCLDNKRLNKQKVEALQILKALKDPEYGWQNHPAVNMWRGYSEALVEYASVITLECIKRGFKDTCLPKIESLANTEKMCYNTYGKYWTAFEYPAWRGLEEFHLSHKSNLIRKDPEHYSKFFPDIPNDIPYYWPSKMN